MATWRRVGGHRTIGEPDRDGARPDSPPRAPVLVRAYGLLGAVVALQLVATYRRRWVHEDGFINIRVAQQVLAGHGPVFNVGERVEAFTSPLWVAVLVVLRILTGGLVAYETLAVAAGIALSIIGTVGCFVGAVALWTPPGRRADRARWLPVGILVPLALSPYWDFATSGLEGGLASAWIGGSFAVVATTLGRSASGPDPVRLRRRWLRYVLVGLGPLVRPELALLATCLGAGLLIGDRRRADAAARRFRWGAGVLAWAAVPAGYQLFRMGYYAAIVPNTALAKDAGTSVWPRGFAYLDNFAGTYWLPLPLLVLAVVLFGRPRLAGIGRDRWLVAALVTGAGVAHAAYVVRAGGDYLHGRLLVVPLLTIVAPFAALPIPASGRARSGRRHAVVPIGTASIAVWAAVAAVALRPPVTTEGNRIDDLRAAFVDFNGIAHPVAVTDQPAPLVAAGRAIAAHRGEDVFVDLPALLDDRPILRPRSPGSGTVARYDAIGVAGVLAGTDVRIVDPVGLADPIAARLPPVGQERAGHTHYLGPAWILARAGIHDPAVPGLAEAHRALDCGAVARYLQAITSPMTPRRFLANVWSATANSRLEVPADPAAAVRAFCPPGRPG